MLKKILSTIGSSVVSSGNFAIPAKDSPLFSQIDWEKLPRHVAIIMDGNGRWAKGKGMIRTAGHSAGVKTLKNILKTAIGLKLDALTVYAFSTENWIDGLPKALQQQMHDAEELMKHNTGVKFNVAANYGGQDELVRAMQAIAAESINGKLQAADINEAVIEEHLDTKGNLPVDLMIRTSGDVRVSNFLLWQAAYAEFWFTDTNWPDFTPECFVDAILDYAKRDRRFGGLNNSK